MISFRGELFFLSNFFPAEIKIMTETGLLTFKTAEHLYQYLKAADRPSRRMILCCQTAGEAKRATRHREFKTRSDWKEVCLNAMMFTLRKKFEQHPELAERLKATEGEIVEENEWGDRFWGTVRGEGQNNLGKLLMQIREELK